MHNQVFFNFLIEFKGRSACRTDSCHPVSIQPDNAAIIIHQRIRNIAAEIDKRLGVRIAVDISHGYPCVVNDEHLVKQAAALAREEKMQVEMLPLRTTAEDFGFYCTKYPSLFYRLGVGAAAGRPHTATFNPDEGAINVGIGFMKRLALQILKK